MTDVDRLYQLPLDEFTGARNALAKERKQPEIKTLEKPNVAAWAVNQLYWHHRAEYERLIAASERLRADHRKLLGGKSSDLRESEKAHRDAVRSAMERIRALLGAGGHAASDQTLNAVQETLEALPSAEPPGRLIRPLKPLGFEALAGVSINPSARPALRIVPPAAARPAERAESPKDGKRAQALAEQRAREERERKERQRQAEQALKAAEAAMLRAEDAVKKAEKELAELKTRRDAAVSEYQRARLRARE
jgi:hypothetical protein